MARTTIVTERWPVCTFSFIYSPRPKVSNSRHAKIGQKEKENTKNRISAIRLTLRDSTNTCTENNHSDWAHTCFNCPFKPDGPSFHLRKAMRWKGVFFILKWVSTVKCFQTRNNLVNCFNVLQLWFRLLLVQRPGRKIKFTTCVNRLK